MYRAGVLTLALTFAASLAAAAPDRRVADAAKARDRAALQSLLKQHADVNGAQGDGATALHWAAHWDDADMVRAADRRGRERRRARPIRASRRSRWRRSTAARRWSRLLLKAGANPNAASSVGETPLMRCGACRQRRASSTALLDAGADVAAREASAGPDRADARGRRESRRRRRDVLLERGADVKRAIEEPLHAAALRRAAGQHRDRAAAA